MQENFRIIGSQTAQEAPHPLFPQRGTHLPFGKYPTTVVPVTNKLMPVNARAILQKEGSYTLAKPGHRPYSSSSLSLLTMLNMVRGARRPAALAAVGTGHQQRLGRQVPAAALT